MRGRGSVGGQACGFGRALAVAVWIAAGATGAAADDPNCSSATSYPPAGANACNTTAQGCTAAAPVVVAGRDNVLLAVLDDHGYCQHGFMWGRVVHPTNGPLERCKGRVCSNAEWISCEADADCPGGATCSPAPVDDCPSGSSCTHGYCSQCTGNGDCAWQVGERCVDGLCSPRQDCSDAGQFACSLGDTCGAVANPCVVIEDAKTCLFTGGTCNVSDDCPQDQKRMCGTTPQMCGRNSDSTIPGAVCTSSTHPLRLNDISCRYRDPDAEEWDHSLTSSTRDDPPLEQIVFTPQIDALASEGAVFPRGWGGAQTCKPGRRTLLTGRFMRHHRNASGKNNGDGVRQCGAPATGLDEPIGCDPLGTSNKTLECGSRPCEQVHSIAWWLENAGTCQLWPHASCATDAHCTGGVGDACVHAHTVGVGKSHFIPFTKLSFDHPVQEGSNPPVGKFPCDGSCGDALEEGNLSCALRADTSSSLKKVFDEITEVRAGGQQAEPLFLYYAPNIPHEPGPGANAPYLRALYETDVPGRLEATLEDDEHLARTSWFDAGLRGIVDHLQRNCVCTGNGTAEPMWKHTTVIVLPDHGYLMDKAKNEESAASNAQRQAIIINAAEHRGRATGEVLDGSSYFAGAQDIMPTVLDYSGLTPSAYTRELDPDFYPLSTSLRSLAKDGMGAGGFLRTHYSHSGLNQGSSSGVADSTLHYMVPKPDLIGVCTNGATTLGHARICLDSDDCGAPAGDPDICRKPGRRCLNRPEIACTSDQQCSSCESGTCNTGIDDVDKDAAGNPRNCNAQEECPVPVGTCAPPILKIVRKAGQIIDVFDLALDPDERNDLSGAPGDSGYLPAPLRAEAQACLSEFFTLRASDEVWAPPPPSPTGCSAAFREW